MLQLLLTILKILGMTALAILGIILAVLLIVLLIPIRYRGEVFFEGKPQGGVLVSWLLRIVTVRADYDGSSLRALVKVFWFRLFDQMLWPSEKIDEVAEDVAETLTEEDFFADVTVTDLMEDDPAERPVSAEEKIPSENPAPVQKNPAVQIQPQTNVQPLTQASEETLSEPTLQTSEESKKPFLEVFCEKLQATATKLVEKTRAIYNGLQDKYTAAQEKINLVQDFLGNAENQDTIRLIWRQVRRLIKHILPTKLRGRVKFGFEDPATTGQILTYISPFYGVYAKTLMIEPVFEEKVLEGELHLKGRIRLGTLLWNVVRVFLNKNFRTRLKKLLKRRK